MPFCRAAYLGTACNAIAPPTLGLLVGRMPAAHKPPMQSGFTLAHHRSERRPTYRQHAQTMWRLWSGCALSTATGSSASARARRGLWRLTWRRGQRWRASMPSCMRRRSTPSRSSRYVGFLWAWHWPASTLGIRNCSGCMVAGSACLSRQPAGVPGAHPMRPRLPVPPPPAGPAARAEAQADGRG